MLQFGKSSAQHELDLFFDSLNISITKSAFSQHRKKLKPQIFMDLNKLLLDEYNQDSQRIKRWKGHKVIAIDGSTMQLPKSNELKEKFGIFKTRTENGRKVVMGRISAMYDTLNNQIIDAKLEPYDKGELTIAEQQLNALQDQDILVADRGYSAFWLMSKLHHDNKHFVIRLKAKRWKIGKQLLESNLNEQTINISPCKTAKYKCKGKGISFMPIKLRLIKTKIKGQESVLVTNLMNQQRYSASDIKKLYRKRWNIEEYFKHLKLREELENLSGKTVVAVMQDFFRMIFRTNFTKIIAHKLTKKQVEKINARRKKKYQVNWTQAARKGRFLLKQIINLNLSLWLNVLIDLKFKLVAQLEIIRKGRSIPIHRRYDSRPASFMAYKP